MEIIWWAEDGYAGKQRPHKLDVPDEELEGLNDEAQDEIIDGYVQEEFKQTVSAGWERA